jgi:DNA-binding FadR family transcriptional regulator
MVDFDGFENEKSLVESPVAWAAAISQHQQVIQAIETQSPQHARKAMQKYL